MQEESSYGDRKQLHLIFQGDVRVQVGLEFLLCEKLCWTQAFLHAVVHCNESDKKKIALMAQICTQNPFMGPVPHETCGNYLFSASTYHNRSCIGNTFLYQNTMSKVGVLPIHEIIFFFTFTRVRTPSSVPQQSFFWHEYMLWNPFLRDNGLVPFTGDNT